MNACPPETDKIEADMVTKFLELWRRAEKASREASDLEDIAVDFAYVALLKYPGFIDHVCELQLNAEKFSADGLLDSILHLKNMFRLNATPLVRTVSGNDPVV